MRAFIYGETETKERMLIIYESECMQVLMERARRFARSAAAVLISGESGTGKELLARSIHENSDRKKDLYLQVNCAALSDQLIESELFGHEAGAFTGATFARVGRLESVGSGTLFLDEIGELPAGTQAKLLRVLEEREYQRVGSNETRTVTARIVVATNRCLGREVQAGRFREDLFHRVNVLSLKLPPLRERKEDLPALIGYFLKRFQHEGECRVERFSPTAMQQLCDYDWPGNIRELRNTILRSCVLARHQEVTDIEFLGNSEQPAEHIEISESLLKLPLDEIERRIIMLQLFRNKGNKTAAAETLGVTSRTLRNKIERYRKLGYVA